jgi:two-component system, LytTR family, sensor kinase
VTNIHEALLVNTIGHFAGAVIFGIFLFLLLRDRVGARLRGSWLSVSAAGCAFLWNLGSVAVLITPTNVNAFATNLLIAFSFSVLSVLPAILLHLSLGRKHWPLTGAGYALSAIAVGLHFGDLVYPGRGYQHRALLLITFGFGALTLAAVIFLALRGEPDRRGKVSRMSGAMCAALFAMSFVHFGSAHPAHAWSSELALHHAGIPLALFVLLQDYRFVLLDAFVRFLANALLAAALTFLMIRSAGAFVHVNAVVVDNPVYSTLLLIGFCLLLATFAVLRGQLQRWLTRVIFRRPDIEKALQEVQARAALFNGEPEFLEWAAEQTAKFMSTEEVAVVPEDRLAHTLKGFDLLFPLPGSDIPGLRHSPDFQWVDAVVPLRLSHGDIRYLLLGRRRGGRRYLSEDLQSLSRLASVLAEQVDRLRNSEMERLVSQAELRALQSQINPHFLFNALNTLYGIIPREVAGARKTVMNLADIFRYFLQSERTFIPLAEEMQIVRAYLDIERLRLGARLETEIEVDEAALSVPIPVLSIQPLVENAVKHGLSQRAEPGLLRLQVKIFQEELLIRVEDTGAGINPDGGFGSGGTGVGLANVTRRLHLCYGLGADLKIVSGPEGTIVSFAVPLTSVAVVM